LLPQQPPASTQTEPAADQSQPATTTPTDIQPPQPAANQPSDPAATANTPPTKPAKSKPRHHLGTAQKTTPQPSTATNGNGKPVAEVAKNTPTPKMTIPEGGTDSHSTSGQIPPGISHDDAIHSGASTDQLLESTDTNLRNIKRQLSTDEQSILTQIQDYVTQSHQATKDGDLVRAHNLALKAHLLSDDLAKQR
jgi:hypothetical protein